MRYLIQSPETIDASIQLPASKSISNRALILNALSQSPYTIENLADCDDTQVMTKALSSQDDLIDIHAAGTAMRFLTAFYAMEEGSRIITGTERMQNRPIRILVDALNKVGADIRYKDNEGFPPLIINGKKLLGGEISLPGNVSSQYISALLMIAPRMEKGLTIHLQGEIVSKPYINLTIQLMVQFGVEAVWEDSTIRVSHGDYSPTPFAVESDWTAASYWYAIKALKPDANISLLGLQEKSYQGDAACAILFSKLGVETVYSPQGITLLSNRKQAERLDYDFVDEPDLAQTFIVLCALKNIPFKFTGLGNLKIKETDRIEAVKTELRRLGYLLKETKVGCLEWNGEHCEKEEKPFIRTYDDHRMAMSFALAALAMKEGIEIAEPNVVRKSYPRFWDDLKDAGFSIKEKEVTE